MYLDLLLVIFLELNSNCGMCSIGNTQLGWMSHMPGFLSKNFEFLGLWRSDAVVCNTFSYHQKWCCILEEIVLLHCCTLGWIAFLVTHCLHYYSIFTDIMASSSISLILLYKVFIIWMPIISKLKYIVGSCYIPEILN